MPADETRPEEDWDLLMSFFPSDWRNLARETNALKGLRKDKSEEHFLRTLLIHLGCGYSLRETAMRASRAQLANLSDVALLKRLRKSKEWLYGLCRSLFAERGVNSAVWQGRSMRLIDATNVKEPGKTGSLWRIHYSLQWPSLVCDHFKVTPPEGKGNGESFQQFPIHRGDYLLADRGYSIASGIHHVRAGGGHLAVRLNSNGIRICDEKNRPFPLLRRVETIHRAYQIRWWRVSVPWRGETPVSGRLCVIRKSEEAIRLAQTKLKRKASKKGSELQPQTLIFAKYVMVLTTFPEAEFSAAEVLEWYRLRWQVELVFKRFKQIVQLGHLPKVGEESAKAWLYGKLFVALVTEKLVHYASAISPWGYDLEKTTNPQSLA